MFILINSCFNIMTLFTHVNRAGPFNREIIVFSLKKREVYNVCVNRIMHNYTIAIIPSNLCIDVSILKYKATFMEIARNPSKSMFSLKECSKSFYAGTPLSLWPIENEGMVLLQMMYTIMMYHWVIVFIVWYCRLLRFSTIYLHYVGILGHQLKSYDGMRWYTHNTIICITIVNLHYEQAMVTIISGQFRLSLEEASKFFQEKKLPSC